MNPGMLANFEEQIAVRNLEVSNMLPTDLYGLAMFEVKYKSANVKSHIGILDIVVDAFVVQ